MGIKLATLWFTGRHSTCEPRQPGPIHIFRKTHLNTCKLPFSRTGRLGLAPALSLAAALALATGTGLLAGEAHSPAWHRLFSLSASQRIVCPRGRPASVSVPVRSFIRGEGPGSPQGSEQQVGSSRALWVPPRSPTGIPPVGLRGWLFVGVNPLVSGSPVTTGHRSSASHSHSESWLLEPHRDIREVSPAPSKLATPNLLAVPALSGLGTML